jgi:hypothetical protein
VLDQTNATVTLVQAPSAGESFDGPPGPGAEKWRAPAGQAPNAYLRVRRDRRQTTAGATTPVDRLLLVESNDPPVEWRSGDVVTLTHAGEQITAPVRAVDRRAIDDPDIPPELQTTRLELEPA